MPHEPFNTAVRDGSIGERVERILMEEIEEFLRHHHPQEKAG